MLVTTGSRSIWTRLVHHDAVGGIVLLAAAVIALFLDNSPFSTIYDGLLGTPVVLRFGAFNLDKPLLLWINDGLMAIFFFYVVLEIKSEMLAGELAAGGATDHRRHWRNAGSGIVVYRDQRR